MEACLKFVLVFGLLYSGSKAMSLVDLLSKRPQTDAGQNFVEPPNVLPNQDEERFKEIIQTENIDVSDQETDDMHSHDEDENDSDEINVDNAMESHDEDAKPINSDTVEKQISQMAAHVDQASQHTQNVSIESPDNPLTIPKPHTCHLRQRMAYGECGHLTKCPDTCSNESDCTFPYCDWNGECQCRPAECSTDEMCEFFRIECDGTFTCKGGNCYCLQEEENESKTNTHRRK